MSGPVHLVRRFLGSLSPRPLDVADEAWVRTVLVDGEWVLWNRMPLADRKHAAGVARDVDGLLTDPPRPVLAAALLHDVGKIDSGLGTFGRVLATVCGVVVGRRRAGAWHGAGLRGRIGRYLRHDAIGADLLVDAGSDPLTVAWAREHHLEPSRSSIPSGYATVLAAADDD